ncbi:MAG TPA: RsiV family protein [Vineibacter sp.]|nr:RsiV family protein [Vineibacter sp.]
MWLRTALLVVMGLAWTTGAFAQGALKIDCSKPVTAADKAGCVRLTETLKTMTTAYERVASSLEGPARDHLVADLARWRSAVETFCVASAGTEPSSVAEARDCVIERTQARLRRLDVMPRGRDYPFISDHIRVEAGSKDGVRFLFVASFPRFDRPGVDNNRANGLVSRIASNTIDKFKPRLGEQTGGENRRLIFDFDYALVYAVPQLVTVITTHAGYLGTTHTAGGTEAAIVDLGTGRVLAPADFLTDDALASMLPIVREYLRVQFRQRQGFDMAVPPDKIAELLREPRRWIARDDRLEVVFNADEIGPYASDAYYVAFPYKYAGALIRRDGPLAPKLP